jgi:AraC-like DNA-binding protein
MVVSLGSSAQVHLPDSLLSVNKAYTYFFTSPDTAQAILQIVRERKLEAESLIDYAEGDLNFNMRQCLKALPYFEKVKNNPAVRDSNFVQMLVLKRMMECYDAIYDEDNMIETTLQLRKKAHAIGNKAFEAMTYFMSGKWHHRNGQKEIGYSSCLEAVEEMKESDYPFKHVELRVFYLELLRMYTRDGRFDDALRMSQLQETEALQPSPALIRNARDRGLREVYALRASVLARAGRMAEADKAYAAWQKTVTANVIDDMNIFDYLQLSHHYDDALGVITNYRDFLQIHGDTVSFRMLSVLNKEALLLMEMGDPEQAANRGRLVGDIAQKLYKRTSGIQMQTAYELFQEQAALERKTLWLSLLGTCVVVVIALVLVILYYVRYIRRRNIEMHHVLNSLDAYRRAVMKGASPTSPEVVAAIEELRAAKLPEDMEQRGGEEPDDEDRRLFVEMDTQVTRDRLFLKPGLGREDLMRLIGVDKNRFGKMMGKYSDASNTSVYINSKRVEYAAQLLLDHPEYTIATVASECGMSNTVTFNRIFKDTYNMTPSEYREKMNGILPTSVQ